MQPSLPLILALIALALPMQAQAEQPAQDIFLTDSATAKEAGPKRLLIDLKLGKAVAVRQLEEALPHKNFGTRDERVDGYLQLCSTYYREQRYEDGVRTCSAAEALKKDSAGTILGLQRLLATVGPARWSRSDVIMLLRDGAWTSVRRGDATVTALVDTGAELGLVSESVAKALNARIVDRTFELGTTTTPVAGRIAVIDELEIGNARLTNLSALVLPDEQLAYSGLKLVIPIQAIIDNKRLAYLDHGKKLALGDAAPPLGEHRTPLYWDEAGIGFAVDFGNGRRGVHFDSGSNRTWLFPAAAEALSPGERASRTAYKRKIGGVGGERTENASKYRGVTMRIGGQIWSFPEIDMAEADLNGESARVGATLLERFGTVTLDFERMEMSVGE